MCSLTLARRRKVPGISYRRWSDFVLALKRQGPTSYGRPLCGQNGSGGVLRLRPHPSPGAVCQASAGDLTSSGCFLLEPGAATAGEVRGQRWQSGFNWSPAFRDADYRQHQPFGEVERFVTQRLLDVIQRIVRSEV